jgi:hypothetical protein
MRQLYSVRNERFGITSEPREEPEPFVEDAAPDVAVRPVAEELQAQERPHGTCGRDHLGPRQGRLLDDAVEGDVREVREEEQQSPKRVLIRRGVRSRSLTSATGATAACTPGGRSSSRLLGGLAKPSPLRMIDTVAGLVLSPGP